ncbi:replication protein [Rhodococcus sp. SJ-3]|uniref:replication protein n=1 Tax=Rhodococcus sp. SJ-3 TaxID=3454628 RepID=UPI003F7B18E4
MSQHTHVSSTGGIRRGPRLADNFTILSNTIINNEALSFRARGVLIWLLSKPFDWSIRSEVIADQSPFEGREAIRTVMRELVAHGYLVREKVQNEKGHWATIQTIYEEPVTSDTTPPEPKTRKSTSGQPRDGQTGAFTKDGSPRTETDNNTGQADTSPVDMLGTSLSLPDSAQKELDERDRNYAALIDACAHAGLPGSFEHVKPAQKSEILAMIDLHGAAALAERAKAMHRDANPTLYAQGWIRLWKAMPRPRPTPTPAYYGTVKCTACEGTGYVMNDDDLAVRCLCRTHAVGRAAA